jgi:uncharacterized protein
VILVDVNLLIYAVFEDTARHAGAKVWWDAALADGNETIALPWMTLSAFIRIATNTKAMAKPLTLDEAVAQVEEWLDLPNVQIINPTEQHRHEFARMLREAQATGNLVTDAHLAALAVEHGCRLASTDGDFARFHGMDWFNPLE